MNKMKRPTRANLKAQLRRLLPERKSSQNKSHGGKCLIVAGSREFLGAAVLSARAAARCGSGYVSLAIPADYFDKQISLKAVLRNPDFLIRKFDSKLIRQIPSDGLSAIAIGPGLGSRPLTRVMTSKLIAKLASGSLAPVVLDADALNTVSQFRNVRRPSRNFPAKFPKTWVMTPHEGELARLLNISAKRIQLNREAAVRNAAKEFGCVVVLKGHHTLIASGEDVWINPTGNSALAKAGTGDVLTGLLAGFLAQGVSTLDAAKLAVFVHGMMADKWLREKKDHLSLMASDLVEEIPKTLHLLRNG